MSKYSIKSLPSKKRPREKLLEQGVEVLSNSELLSIIFITGTRKEGVLELASRVIKEYGSRSITQIRNVEKAMELLGLGLSKASQLVAVFELGRRFFSEQQERMPTIRDPLDVFKLCGNMGRLKREELRALYLNIRQKVVREEIIAIGSLNMNIVTPKEILQGAVELMCSAYVLVHNHPSGESKPSKEDERFTQKLKKASDILGVEFLDHIIIAQKEYTSLKNLGII